MKSRKKQRPEDAVPGLHANINLMNIYAQELVDCLYKGRLNRPQCDTSAFRFEKGAMEELGLSQDLEYRLSIYLHQAYLGFAKEFISEVGFFCIQL